jgi:MoaA/NifB/PqqE/SkfB family radical SAM enzyme
MDQMMLKADRVASWADGKPMGPARIEIHPTNVCNLKCKFCWQTTVKGKVSRAGEISYDDLINLVNDAADINVKEWIVSGGGEPFVRGNETLGMMIQIKKRKMWGQLTTNGTLLTEEQIKTIVKIGWDQVQISLDGPDSKTHDFIRSVPGTFDRAVKSAKLLSFYRKKLGKNTPYLGFNTCITRHIHNKLKEMILLGKDAGFDLVFFEPVYAGYVSKHRFTLNKKETEILQNDAKDAKILANKIGIATNVDRFVRTELVDKSNFGNVVLREAKQDENKYVNAPCYQPWYLMGIKANGLAGCCSTFETGEYIHNKSLKEVWFGKLFDQIRRDMLDRKLPEYCKKCSVVVVTDNQSIRDKLRKVKKKSLFGIFKNG